MQLKLEIAFWKWMIRIIGIYGKYRYLYIYHILYMQLRMRIFARFCNVSGDGDGDHPCHTPMHHPITTCRSAIRKNRNWLWEEPQSAKSAVCNCWLKGLDVHVCSISIGPLYIVYYIQIYFIYTYMCVHISVIVYVYYILYICIVVYIIKIHIHMYIYIHT